MGPDQEQPERQGALPPGRQLLAGAEGDVALGEAYKRLANNYENPETIESVTWGFIDGQGI